MRGTLTRRRSSVDMIMYRMLAHFSFIISYFSLSITVHYTTCYLLSVSCYNAFQLCPDSVINSVLNRDHPYM